MRVKLIRFLAFFLVLICVSFAGGWYVAKKSMGNEFAQKAAYAESQAKILDSMVKNLESLKRELSLRKSALEKMVSNALGGWRLDSNIVAETEESALSNEELGMGGGEDMGFGDFGEFEYYEMKVKGAKSSAGSNKIARSIDSVLDEVELLPFGPPVFGRVTSRYGYRRNPISGKSQFHKGIDLALDRKSPVLAPADGTVIFAGRKGGYGNTIIISHSGGYKTLYAHLSKINVEVGQEVCRTQEIGWVGSTGSSTAPHLHYEIVKNGKRVNPLPFIQFSDLLM